MSTIDFTQTSAPPPTAPLSFISSDTDGNRSRLLFGDRVNPGVSLNPQQIAHNTAVDAAQLATTVEAVVPQPVAENIAGTAPAEEAEGEETIDATTLGPTTVEDRIKANINRWCEAAKKEVLELAKDINPQLKVEFLDYEHEDYDGYIRVQSTLQGKKYDVFYIIRPSVKDCLVKFIGAPLLKQAVSSPVSARGTITHKGKYAVLFYNQGMMARLHYMDLFTMYDAEMKSNILAGIKYATAVTLFNIDSQMYALAKDRVENAKRNLKVFEDRIKTKLAELEKANADYIEADRALSAANLMTTIDNTVKRDIEELKKLMPSMYTSFTYENSAFVGKTNEIYIDYEGKRYSMGTFQVKINFKTNELRISGGNCRNPSYPHPHVTGSQPCLGNISTAISQMLRDGKIYGMYHTLHFFLCSYNKDSPYIRIDQFPSTDIPTVETKK